MHRPNDPIEAIIFDALSKAGIEFQIGEKTFALDFYLVRSGVYIECKAFHTPRVGQQLARYDNVILIQGREAAETFAAMLA